MIKGRVRPALRQKLLWPNLTLTVLLLYIKFYSILLPSLAYLLKLTSALISSNTDFMVSLIACCALSAASVLFSLEKVVSISRFL